jgi:NitT/TauT family transport system permease protein
MNSRWRPVLLPVLTFVVLILAWQAVVVGFEVPEFLLPRPTAIFAAALRFGWPLLTVHATTTLETILLGFVISAVIAVPLGVLLAANKLASEAFYPLLIFTHAIPVIAIAPIVVVGFGTGLKARLIVVTLISFFPIMVSTVTGILNAPAEMLDLGRTVGASKWQRIATIAFPHAIPFIFNGFRIGIVGSVIGAVVGEFVSANSGLGYLVVRSTSDFDIPTAMACVIILATMSVMLYQLTAIVQAHISPWAPRGDDRR